MTEKTTSTTPTRVSLSVTSDDSNTIARAVELLARTAAGLALDGIETHLMTYPDDEDEGDE